VNLVDLVDLVDVVEEMTDEEKRGDVKQGCTSRARLNVGKAM
jgi:hypothetical protein